MIHCVVLCIVDNNHLMVVGQWLQINLAQCSTTQRDALLLNGMCYCLIRCIVAQQGVPRVHAHHNFTKSQEHL